MGDFPNNYIVGLRYSYLQLKKRVYFLFFVNMTVIILGLVEKNILLTNYGIHISELFVVAFAFFIKVFEVSNLLIGIYYIFIFVLAYRNSFEKKRMILLVGLIMICLISGLVYFNI